MTTMATRPGSPGRLIPALLAVLAMTSFLAGYRQALDTDTPAHDYKERFEGLPLDVN